MNVWIFNHYAGTPKYPGGTRHFELGQRLAAQGVNVAIFASNILHMDFQVVEMAPGEICQIQNFDGLRFIWIKTPLYRRNNWKRFLNMLVFCRNARRTQKRLLKKRTLPKPDLIVGSTVHPFASWMAGRIAQRHGCPFVFEIRDLWPQTFIDMGVWSPSSLGARIFRRIEKKTIRRARGFIVLSPKTVEYLGRMYGISPDKIICLPNGADTSGPVSPRERSAPGRFRLVYVGSINSVQSIDVLLRAMQILESLQPEVELRIYGEGMLKGAYEKKYALSNIRWMGAVEKSKVPEVLAEADLLFLSTGRVYYGSENKLYDYLAAAKPIISSVSGDHNDIIGPIGAGLSIPAGEVQPLVEGIRHVSSLSRREREEMGERGRRFVKEHFDWDLLAKDLKAFLDRMG